jgi:hypothetical protein
MNNNKEFLQTHSIAFIPKEREEKEEGNKSRSIDNKI